MQLVDDRLILSASDLINYLECAHLTHLDLEVATASWRSTRRAPTPPTWSRARATSTSSPTSSRCGRRGARSSRSQSEPGLDGLRRGARADARGDAARRGGHLPGRPVRRRALARLRRLPRARGVALGARGVELRGGRHQARAPREAVLPAPALLLLRAARAAQGRAPEWMHVVLGTRARESFRVAEFAAYYRRVKGQLRAARSTAGLDGTYPDPVEHCGLCRWEGICDARREADDHLSLVANMRRSQTRGSPRRASRRSPSSPRATLGAAPGADRRAHLRGAPRAGAPPGRAAHDRRAALRAARRRRTARLRAAAGAVGGRPVLRHGGRPVLRGRPRVPVRRHLDRGRRAALPRVLGDDRAEEKRAFEAFIDFVMERLERFPDLHVYHYAPYEPTALKRLMGLHATREDEIDHLLRDEVLVDLYAVVRQGLRISQPSYSIKKVEAFYMERARHRGRRGRRLDHRLRGVPRDRRPVAARGDRALQRRRLPLDLAAARLAARAPRRGDRALRARRSAWRPAPEPWRADPEDARGARRRCAARSRRRSARGAGRARRRTSRRAGCSRSCSTTTGARPSRSGGSTSSASTPTRSSSSSRHRGARRAQTPASSRGRCRRRHARRSTRCASRRRSTRSRLGSYVDPATEKGVSVERVDDADGHRRDQARHGARRRAAAARADPRRRRMTPASSARRCAGSRADVLARGLDADGSLRAPCARSSGATCRARAPARPARRCRRERVRPRARRRSSPPASTDSYLFVQGPPGSGKTYTGAHLICHLLARGARVGVASSSHTAIHNLLAEVERFAGDRPGWRGLQEAQRHARTAASLRARRAADRELRRHRRLHRAASAPGRRHRLAVRARGARRHARLPVRRRGRPDLARRRARDRHQRPQPRPARRPAAARPGLAGHPSARRRRLGARAPARRQRARSRRTAACSSTRPAACTRTSAASSPRPSTRAASSPSPTARARTSTRRRA